MDVFLTEDGLVVGIVVKALDSQSRGPKFKTAGWLQGQYSLSSFWGWLNKYQELLGTEW